MSSGQQFDNRPHIRDCSPWPQGQRTTENPANLLIPRRRPRLDFRNLNRLVASADPDGVRESEGWLPLTNSTPDRSSKTAQFEKPSPIVAP